MTGTERFDQRLADAQHHVRNTTAAVVSDPDAPPITAADFDVLLRRLAAQVAVDLPEPERVAAARAALQTARTVTAPLDRLAAAAAGDTATPAALATIVDDRMQWTVGRSGGGDDRPANDSFCQFVAAGRGTPFAVDDAAVHALVCDSVAVSRDGLRAYLGYPLIYRRHVVGALCVIDFSARRWRPGDHDTVRRSAQAASTLLASA